METMYGDSIKVVFVTVIRITQLRPGSALCGTVGSYTDWVKITPRYRGLVSEKEGKMEEKTKEKVEKIVTEKVSEHFKNRIGHDLLAQNISYSIIKRLPDLAPICEIEFHDFLGEKNETLIIMLEVNPESLLYCKIKTKTFEFEKKWYEK
jgi:hypothetical protein